MTTTAHLDITFDGLPWVVGPTENRPYDQWLAEVVPVMEQVLELPPDQPRLKAYLVAVLQRVGQDDEDSPLPYRMLRWLRLPDPPLVASFGLSTRGSDEDHDAYLLAADSGPVETPMVVEVEGAPAGVSVRRSVAYSEQEGGLLIEQRYLVDDGDPDHVALLHVATRDPADLVGALEDLDEVARRMRVAR